jgi:hypothetical protein
MREDLPDAGIESEDSRRAIELLEHGAEDSASPFHYSSSTGASVRV